MILNITMNKTPKFKPGVQTPHKVALSIESRQKKELDQMEKQDITDKPLQAQLNS